MSKKGTDFKKIQEEMKEQIGGSSDSDDIDDNDDLFDGVEVEVDDEIPQFEEDAITKSKNSTLQFTQPQFKQQIVENTENLDISTTIFEQKTFKSEYNIKSGPQELLAFSQQNSGSKNQQANVNQLVSNTIFNQEQNLAVSNVYDGPKLTVTQKLLNLEKDIKSQKRAGKNSEEIKKLLHQYCLIANEEAQNYVLSDSNQQLRAMNMLEQCINVIKLVQDEQNQFNELHYETLNNIARCHNFSGNIRISLQFLIKAFKHVQMLQKTQEQGSVTIMPELSLNICNAYIYENNNLEALSYAEIAIKSSNECIKVLSKKIDKKVTQKPNQDLISEKARLNQLYQSQIQLNIQGYQAKGKILEKMSRFKEAIKQYNLAKIVVEQNFGTNHQLFKDIVNQVSAANVNLKTKNYQGRSNLSLKSASFKSLKRGTTSKQATSAQSPDKVLVQFSEDTIDIRSVGGNSDFGQNSIMSTPSNQTEQQKKKRKNLVSGKSQKRLQSQSRSPQEGGMKSRRLVRSIRPKRVNGYDYNNVLQYINQPPFNAGFPSSGFNRFNHIQGVNRFGDQWKFNQHYTPNMLGSLGYNYYNLDRKNCFYHTPTIQKQLVIKKKIIRDQPVKPQIAQPQVVMQQIPQPNRDDSKLDIYLKEMQIKQQEQQQAMFDVINKQKETMIELQRKERERARKEREAFLIQLQQLSNVQVTTINQTEVKKVVDLVPQLPPVHPIFGPAVYDEKGKFWYYKQKQASPKKKEMVTSYIQTDQAPKIQFQEMALQTDEVEQFQFIPPKPQPLQQTIYPPQIKKDQKPKRMDYEKAITILQKFFRNFGLKKREKEFYDKNHGILLDRKYLYNAELKAFEIMSMYVVPTIDDYCNCLKFSIYNYAQKRYSYLGVFDKFFTLKKYQVSQIQNLTKNKIKKLEFEYKPFREHILCIQQILNQQRKDQNIVLINKNGIIEEVIQGPGEIVIDEQKPINLPNFQQQTNTINIEFIDKPIKKIQLWWKKQYKRIIIIRAAIALTRNKKLLVTIRRIIYSQGSERLFLIQLFEINPRKDSQELIYHILQARAMDDQKKDFIDLKRVRYNKLRLPDDDKHQILKEYMKESVCLELDKKTGKISELKLLRLMIDPKPMPKIGCILHIEFPLENYQNHICKVYKRQRWEDPKNKKQIVKDWKIKVIQEGSPNSDDYIVVRRLPCQLSLIDTYIQQTLEIIPNRRVIPNSILHLQWRVNSLLIKSQKYYDLNSSRLTHVFQSAWYFSQYTNAYVRVPEDLDIEKSSFAPFYEIYIQRMVPKYLEAKPIRYRTLEYLNYKESQRKKKYQKYRHIRGEDSPSSSESEDDDLPQKYSEEISKLFWDEEYLIKMQLDEVTESREYFKITVTRTSDKQDSDFFRIEKEVAKWPHPEVEYQYLMQNLSLKQIKNQVTGEFNIEVIGLKIRNFEDRFISDEAWLTSVKEDEQLEIFMSQDMNRWRNQNFACTVYNTSDFGQGFLIEAINVDHPNQRAYKRESNLGGMRGNFLKCYIDQKLRIIGNREMDQKALLRADQQFGFGSDFVIDKIEFICTPEDFKQEMIQNPKFLNWHFEDITEEKENLKYDENEIPEEKEDEKSEYLANLWAKFSIMSEPHPKYRKKVELQVEIRLFTNPIYFQITITNSLNEKIGSDTQIFKIQKLPEPLTIKDKSIQKIQECFNKKLKIIWMDQKEWTDPEIPQILDAFIDNTIMKEQIIQKLVEVKVWDDYHKKIEERGSSDSDEPDVSEQEMSLIKQDVQVLKQLIKHMKSILTSMFGGMYKWFSQFDINGRDEVDLDTFKTMLTALNINIDIRIIIMLYLVFDRSYQGYFRFSDFEDIILKRIQLQFKSLVYIERIRFKSSGSNIKFPPRQILNEQQIQNQVVEEPQSLKKLKK